MTFRLPVSHQEYVYSKANDKDISKSEFIRIIIDKDRRGEGVKEPTESEVVSFLKGLSSEEREYLLDKVEQSEKRRIKFFIDKTIEQNPKYGVSQVAEMVNKRFNVPIDLNLRRRIGLRIKSTKRKRKFVYVLEEE